MPGSNQHRPAKLMRWAARVIGLGTAGFMLLMLIGAALTEGPGQDIAEAVQGISLGMLELIALAGCIVSWWRERLAGVLLISVALGLGIHIGVCAGHNHLLAWSMVGLPYMVAGVLLLVSRRVSRRV